MASLNDKLKYIFDEICISANFTPPNIKGMKFEITTNSREQFDFFKSLKNINIKKISYNLTCAKYEDNDNSYVAFIGVSSQHFNIPDDQGVEEFDVDTPSFIFLSDEMSVKVRSNTNNNQLKNEILFQQEEPNYQGHNFYEVYSYFQDIVIFKIDKTSILDDFELTRLFYYLLSHNEKISSFGSDNINDLYKSILLNINNISYENIFLSMTSYHRKHSFLEVYRCLEWIYTIPRIIKLRDDISYDGIAFNLANSCVKHLAWKRKEEDSLCLLVEEAFSIDRKFEEKSAWMEIFKDISVEKIASHLYRLRNQFVHQFNPEREISITESEFEELIYFTLELTHIIYDKYHIEMK